MPRRSLAKTSRITLSEMRLALRSMNNEFGEEQSGGTRPTKGLLVREETVFLQLRNHQD